MLCMRKLLKELQVSFPSIQEVRFELDHLVNVAKNRMELSIQGKAANQQHVMNGLMLVVAAMPDEKKAELLADAFARLEAMLAEDRPPKGSSVEVVGKKTAGEMKPSAKPRRSANSEAG